MKFFTAIVALAGVSSTNAALRGVLPAHMKELLTDKFAAVEDLDCSGLYQTCVTTDDCDECTGGGSWTCNHVSADNSDGNGPGDYCRPNDGSVEEEDISANMKELLTDKFTAVEDLDCSGLYQTCVTTDDCDECTGGGSWTCNHVSADNSDGNGPGDYCRPNDGSVEEEDISAN